MRRLPRRGTVGAEQFKRICMIGRQEAERIQVPRGAGGRQPRPGGETGKERVRPEASWPRATGQKSPTVDVRRPASQSTISFGSGVRRITASTGFWDMEAEELVTTMEALDGSTLSSVRAEDARVGWRRQVVPRFPSNSKPGHFVRVGLLPAPGITL